MSALSLAVPGSFSGVYAQRDTADDRNTAWLARWLKLKPFATRCAQRRYASFVAQVRAAATVDVAQVRRTLGRDGVTERELAEAFAVVCGVFERVFGLRPYDLQIAAARAMLDGHLAEMPTGEGKTLVAALTACVAALAGAPVHVLTANDYLVERDAQWLKPACDALSLEVRHIGADMNPAQRRSAYAADIVYATAKELVFDYLRDRMLLGSLREDLPLRVARLTGTAAVAAKAPTLRGLYFCIVDEADSILLDEARTPLILARSAPGAGEAAWREAMGAAQLLRERKDFKLDREVRTVELVQRGQRQVRDELVELALAALHLYERDRDYVVREGKIEIVDPNTGRVAEGRAWSQGLHQMIELKEGLPFTSENETIARLTYQGFFPRYHRACGLSGTLAESSLELGLDYGLPMLRVPSRVPSQRVLAEPALYAAASDKWTQVVDEIKQVHATGRPVLVGTGSVGESERLSAQLAQAGIAHTVLNARQDGQEAAQVAAAGQPGAVTVATNMAGRGTDIRLAGSARQRGGLHVVAAHINESVRIDRQLWGRCARQGDPGSARVIASLDDAVFVRALPHGLRRSIQWAFARRPLPVWLARTVVSYSQWSCEYADRRARRALRRYDEHMDRRLSFGQVRE